MQDLFIRDVVYLVVYVLSFPIIYYILKYLMKSLVHEIVSNTHKEMQQSTSAIFQQIADNYELKDVERTKDLLKDIKNLITEKEKKIFEK